MTIQLYIIHEQSSRREKHRHMHNEEILRHAELAKGLLCVPTPSLQRAREECSYQRQTTAAVTCAAVSELLFYTSWEQILGFSENSYSS